MILGQMIANSLFPLDPSANGRGYCFAEQKNFFQQGDRAVDERLRFPYSGGNFFTTLGLIE